MFEKREKLKGELKEYNRGSELIQSTLYIPMELSPGNPFVLFTYANKNSKKMLIFFCMISLLWINTKETILNA